MKQQLITDLRDIERYLEKETDKEHTESPVIFGILRVLYHLTKAEIMRLEREERSKLNG